MSILFVSDLHLSAARPDKTGLFYDFLRCARTRAGALYILGDLFEFWLGDDDDSDPHEAVVAALGDLSVAGVALFVMRGNRDFLFGDRFVRDTGATLLPDYHLADLFGRRALLTHGDLLCTKDVEYQAFRRYVRDPVHQADFLSKSLAQRRQIAAQMRSGTRASMLEKDDFIMDVDDDTVAATMREFSVQTLIHGHTHRPAIHRFEIDGAPCSRIVLGDWYDQGSVVEYEPDGSIMRLRVSEFLRRCAPRPN